MSQKVKICRVSNGHVLKLKGNRPAHIHQWLKVLRWNLEKKQTTDFSTAQLFLRAIVGKKRKSLKVWVF